MNLVSTSLRLNKSVAIFLASNKRVKLIKKTRDGNKVLGAKFKNCLKVYTFGVL
jgi:hypothetical protein